MSKTVEMNRVGAVASIIVHRFPTRLPWPDGDVERGG